MSKIRAGQRRLAGERKHVTVLFADVTGSMALAESVDPEAWQRIMDRFFALLCDGVHRFEGTVNKFTGDGIMALFGAPIAHEDHAQRACYAALHLRDELAGYAGQLRREHGLNFSVRMGLNSGEVVVGTIGDDLQLDYTAIGHTVGLAQRVESLAEPGQAYLTEQTARLVDGFFALTDLGAFDLKGVSQPARVSRLDGPGSLRTRLDVAGVRGLSRFVGRTDEFASLEAALADTREGRGCVVGVVGDAGMGKSRLCHELVQRCRVQGIAVYEGHGVSHGKRIALLPILELVRGSLGITERDSEQETREKIAGRLLLLDDAFGEDLPFVFDFLGVPDSERPAPRMDAEARQRRIFAIGQRMIQARARREPAVHLLEDLHWFDDVSEAYLANNIDAATGTRTLIVTTFRPSYHADWMESSVYRLVALKPLGDAAADELLRDLLGTDPSLDGLAEQIRERTGGNPFFIEEVVQALAEGETLEGARGNYRLAGEIGDIAIPPTVLAVLAARIDRLGDREKAVLQTAAVIGREFSETVLRRVAEGEEGLPASLAALVDAGLIVEQALYPDVEYAFRHPLTHEVALGSQLTERRVRTHAAVARALTELASGDDGERAALLAHHWEAARNAVEAAAAHRRAAEWAGVLHPDEAIRHWRKVRELLANKPETDQTAKLVLAACTQVLNLGWRVGLPEQEMTAALQAGRALAQRSGDIAGHAHLLTTAAAARGVGPGDLPGALALGSEVAKLPDLPPDRAIGALAPRAYCHYLLGNLRAALTATEELIEATRDDPRFGLDIFGYSLGAWARMMRAFTLPLMGRAQEAPADRQRALALAREVDDAETIGWVRASYTIWAMVTGETDGLLEQTHETWEIAERLGSAFSQVVALQALARAHILRGGWADAAAACERGLDLARSRRASLASEGSLLSTLADARLGLGDVDAARSTAEEAIAVSQRRGTRVFELMAQLTLARTLLATGDVTALDLASAGLDRALSLADETGAASMEPLTHVVMAELEHARGDEIARARELDEARRLFEAIGAPKRAAQLASAV